MINPFHVVNTCLILEIFITLCWQTDENIILIVKSLTDMKK